MTVLFSARFALHPLGKEHKIKPFQSIDDFLLIRIEKSDKNHDDTSKTWTFIVIFYYLMIVSSFG